jgi:hypothetical protein
VDYAGKLFERINANAFASSNFRYRNTAFRHTSASSEFLPAPRKPSGQGVFRIAGLGSFVTFLAH